MTIEHVAITDPEIHEPKGASSASDGEVYIADGLGSGSWTNLLNKTTLSNVKIVNSIDDLPLSAGGERQTVDGTIYAIGADINITDSFRINGTVAFVGMSRAGGSLNTTSASPLFVGQDASLYIDHLNFSNPNGKIFDFADTTPGTSRVTVTNYNCSAYREIGDFDGLNLVQFSTGTFRDTVNSIKGMTFSVASGWNVISIRETIIITANAAVVGVDLGNAISNTIEFQNYIFNGVAGSTAISGQASNGNLPTDTIGTVTSCTLNGGGATPLAGITQDDFRWEFFGNSGVPDTRPDALLSLQSNATATAISAPDTPVKLAGTWVNEGDSHFVGDTTGRITYPAERPFKTPFTVRCSLEPVSGTNKNISLYLAKNGSIISGTKSSIKADSGSPQSVTTLWQDTFNTNDYIEVWAENNSDSVDILGSSAVFRLN